MQSSTRGMEVILDTHAIREILLNSSKEQLNKILKAIKERCHTLVIPRLEKEHRIRLDFSQFLQLTMKFRTKLHGKFIPSTEPESDSYFPSELIKVLRKCRADDNDIIIARVAYRRARTTKRKALIVSDDESFHECEPFLRRYNIEVKYVEEFLKFIIV